MSVKSNVKIARMSATLLAAVAALLVWAPWRVQGSGASFVSGNGRIDATEIAVATQLAGRIEKIWVSKGDFVKVGQPLAQMQIESLQAQRDEVLARW
jgi:HlyD family secretion protein